MSFWDDLKQGALGMAQHMQPGQGLPEWYNAVAQALGHVPVVGPADSAILQSLPARALAQAALPGAQLAPVVQTLGNGAQQVAKFAAGGELLDAAMAVNALTGNQNPTYQLAQQTIAQGAQQQQSYWDVAQHLTEQYSQQHPVLGAVLQAANDPTNLLFAGAGELGLVQRAAPVETQALTLAEKVDALRALTQAIGPIAAAGKRAQALAEAGGIDVAKQATTKLLQLPNGRVLRVGHWFGDNPTPEIQDWQAIKDKAVQDFLDALGPDNLANKDERARLNAEPVGLALKDASGRLVQAQQRAGWQRIASDADLAKIQQQYGGVFLEQPTGDAATKWQSVRQKLNLSSAWTNYKQQLVNTPRNLTQDVLNSYFWLKAAGLPEQDVVRNLTDMVAQAAAGTPLETTMPTRLANVLELLGLHGENLKEPFSLAKEVGMGFLDTTGHQDAFLDPKTSALLAAIQGGLNPLRARLPLVGLGLDALRGYYQAGINGAFGAASHLIQGSFRTTALEAGMGDELGVQAEKFLRTLPADAAAKLRQAGRANYTRLKQATGAPFDMYQPESLFTPQDVAQVLGDKAGMAKAKDWQDAILAAKDTGAHLARDTFGDFSLPRTGVQRYLDYAIPFLGWTRVAYPLTLRLALQHPTVVNFLAHAMQADAELAQRENRPPWTVGSIPLTDTTPLVGLAVRALNGGLPGEARPNPLAFLTPLPLSTLGGDSQGDSADANYYEQIKAALDAIGMSPSPIVDTAAYAAGLSNTVPRPAARDAGLTVAIGQALGSPDIPAPEQGALNAVRKAQNLSTIADPVKRTAEELVLLETGRPVSAPEYHQYAVQIAQKTGIYKAAEQVYNTSQAVKTAVGYVNPASLSVQNAAQQAYYQAQAGQPVSRQQLQQDAAADPIKALVDELANQQYAQQAPATALYQMPQLTAAEKADPRLAAFRTQYLNLAVSQPALYAALEAQFKRANRIP